MTDRRELENCMDCGGGVVEEAVAFVGPQGMLRGVMGRPADRARGGRPCVVFVHGWSGVRGGPHGILTGLARDWTATLGVKTLRFDLGGRGESDGDGLEASLAGMAADVGAAARFALQRSGSDRLVLCGVCSGGNVAIGTLPAIGRGSVAGLVLLSVYPFSDGDSLGRDVGRTWHFLRVYARKLCARDTWRRLLSGEIDVAGVAGVLFGHFKKAEGACEKVGNGNKKEEENHERIRNAGTAKGQTAFAVARESRNEENARTDKPLNALKKNMPALMVYGTADPDAKPAMDYFREYAEPRELPLTFRKIEGADHNFAAVEWTKRVAQEGQQFLRQLAGET